MGDFGFGKSYFLGRIKKIFNIKVFFVYVNFWFYGDYIW